MRTSTGKYTIVSIYFIYQYPVWSNMQISVRFPRAFQRMVFILLRKYFFIFMRGNQDEYFKK